VTRPARDQHPNRIDLLRRTTDNLRLRRLSIEVGQQAARDRRRREDEIREELRDSRATTITGSTPAPQRTTPKSPDKLRG
jgi:hypothetical protein